MGRKGQPDTSSRLGRLLRPHDRKGVQGQPQGRASQIKDITDTNARGALSAPQLFYSSKTLERFLMNTLVNYQELITRRVRRRFELREV